MSSVTLSALHASLSRTVLVACLAVLAVLFFPTWGPILACFALYRVTRAYGPTLLRWAGYIALAYAGLLVVSLWAVYHVLTSRRERRPSAQPLPLPAPPAPEPAAEQLQFISAEVASTPVLPLPSLSVTDATPPAGSASMTVCEPPSHAPVLTALECPRNAPTTETGPGVTLTAPEPSEAVLCVPGACAEAGAFHRRLVAFGIELLALRLGRTAQPPSAEQQQRRLAG